MAVKGNTVHSGLVWTAKALGGLILTMIFGLTIWAIQASHYQP
jgi:hypothetical protein